MMYKDALDMLIPDQLIQSKLDQLLQRKDIIFEDFINRIDSLEISYFFHNRRNFYEQTASIVEAISAWEKLESFYSDFCANADRCKRQLFACNWSSYAAQEALIRWEELEEWRKSTHKVIQGTVTRLKAFKYLYSTLPMRVVRPESIEEIRKPKENSGIFSFMLPGDNQSREEHFKKENIRTMKYYYENAKIETELLPSFEAPRQTEIIMVRQESHSMALDTTQPGRREEEGYQASSVRRRK